MIIRFQMSASNGCELELETKKPVCGHLKWEECVDQTLMANNGNGIKHNGNVETCYVCLFVGLMHRLYSIAS